jgi:GT2 family glycosyltransferase
MSVLGIMPEYVSDKRQEVLTLKAIDSYLKTTPGTAYLHVYDDASPRRRKMEGLVEGRGAEWFGGLDNRGFAYTVNEGLEKALAHGYDALLVNADLEFFQPDWLETMLETDADIVGAKLLYPNHLIQHAGVYYSAYSRLFSHIGRFAPENTPEFGVERECPVTGALMLIRHPVLKKIGLLDEDFPFAFEDIDYCLRAMQAGLKVKYQPKAVAIHHESSFRGAEPSEKHKKWMQQGWDHLQTKHAGLDIASLVPTLLES